MKQRLQKKRYGIDADRIIPGLYQGSRPSKGSALRLAGFDALVLCAGEFQPDAGAFPGMRVHHAPLDDHQYRITDDEWMQIISAAEFAMSNIHRNRRVLVTCQMGWNRSGIVNGVAVMMLTGCKADEAVRQIRRKRSKGLSNRSFAKQLNILPA
jgi:protein-tyrosine phosphatase